MQCDFDRVLKEKWEEAQRNGVFRYILNIRESKVLPGKYKFLAQLNPDRGENRRTPENIGSMNQAFNPERFNFTKLHEKEVILDLDDSDGENIIAVNVSPLENYHCLLLTERFQNLPQIVTQKSLQAAFELFSLSHSPFLRVCFNSLCANASVNHLHWHLYYLDYTMMLEDVDLEDFAGPVKLLKNYPAKGFCLKSSDFKNQSNFVDWSFFLINYLQTIQMAHNVYITRSGNIKNQNGDLRIYIWPRKSHQGVKNTMAFIPAACELFGHLSIRSEEAYKSLTEDYVANILNDLTEGCVASISDELKKLITDRINNERS